MTLYEELEKEFLVEGIKEVQAKYPNIAEEKFFELIKLDPTYKDGVDSVGTYGKWILNLYNKNKLKDEDFYKVTDYLTEFEEKKKWMPSKDIGFYKTLPDLKKAIDDTEISMSQNQKNKAFKKKYKQADLDADLVYEDEKWEIWIPNTYESSCKLATDTEWCTGPSSHGNDYYYNMYTKEGPLYINLNKHDEDEKYQFHFPSHQFMDTYDKEINLREFLKQKGNEGLNDFYTNIFEKNIRKILNEYVNEPNHTAATYLSGLFDDYQFFIFDERFEKEIDSLLSEAEFFMNASDYESRSKDVSTEFLQDCFSGDLWDYFIGDYYETSSLFDNTEVLEYIDNNDTIRREIKGYGLPENIFTLLADDELPEEYEPLADSLNDAIMIAIADGQKVGAENEALSDFERALSLNTPEGVFLKWKDENGASYKLSRKFFSTYDYLLQDELSYRGDNVIEKVLFEEVNYDLNFYEPYSGWFGFDEDAFIDTLSDQLFELDDNGAFNYLNK